MRYLNQCREFYHEFRHAFQYTGSILPSSPGLARALVSCFRRRPTPARVLEVGPGTGAVTTELLRHLRSGDQVDLVEISRQFVDVLRARFSAEPLWRSRRPQTQLIHAPLQDVPGFGLYDYVISGIPLNNFPLSEVREIFQSYLRLLKPDGILSYFEYFAVRDLKRAFVPPKEQRRLRVLGRFLDRRIRAYQIRQQWVFMNVPPAVARHFCFST